MGTLRALPAQSGGVRLADAVSMFLDTISVPTNTRRGYGAAVNRLVADFGADPASTWTGFGAPINAGR
jgi:integrase/recombinase XerC/integrase/recombinase XerD